MHFFLFIRKKSVDFNTAIQHQNTAKKEIKKIKIFAEKKNQNKKILDAKIAFLSSRLMI